MSEVKRANLPVAAYENSRLRERIKELESERDRLRVERDTYENVARFHANKVRRLREALERVAKSNPELPPASRFVVIAREALGQSIDLEVAQEEER